jgi:hypothetical protein
MKHKAERAAVSGVNPELADEMQEERRNVEIMNGKLSEMREQMQAQVEHIAEMEEAGPDIHIWPRHRHMISI